MKPEINLGLNEIRTQASEILVEHHHQLDRFHVAVILDRGDLKQTKTATATRTR